MKYEQYVREIGFNEIEEGMFLEQGGKLFSVENVSKVEQVEGNVEVTLYNSLKDFTLTLGAFTYEQMAQEEAILLVGVQNGPVVRWLDNPPVKDPVPEEHERFIRSIVVNDEKISVGDVLNEYQVAEIEVEQFEVANHIQTTFRFLTSTGLVFHATCMVDANYSISYGFREKTS